MKRKNKFLLVLKKIKEALNKDYPFKKKYDELKLSGFKIHPIFGDIEILKKKEKELVSALWQIGKIEEIINKNYKNITVDELQAIFEFINFIKNKNQNFEISEENFLSQKLKNKNKDLNLEMEIFQEESFSKKIIN